MILAIGTVVGIVVAVVSIINPLFTNGAFEGYTGQSWSEFAEQQPEQAALYQHLSRAGDLYWLVGAVICLFVILASYRKGEKWAWTAILTAGALAHGGTIVFGAIFSDPLGITLGIISMCVLLVALLIPAKEIWKAKPEETG